MSNLSSVATLPLRTYGPVHRNPFRELACGVCIQAITDIRLGLQLLRMNPLEPGDSYELRLEKIAAIRSKANIEKDLPTFRKADSLYKKYSRILEIPRLIRDTCAWIRGEQFALFSGNIDGDLVIQELIAEYPELDEFLSLPASRPAKEVDT